MKPAGRPGNNANDDKHEDRPDESETKWTSLLRGDVGRKVNARAMYDASEYPTAMRTPLIPMKKPQYSEDASSLE